MEGELEDVVRILAENRWPWRMHATYDRNDQTRTRRVSNGSIGIFHSNGLNWFFDHAETISNQSIGRIAALGGGVAVAAPHGLSG